MVGKVSKNCIVQLARLKPRIFSIEDMNTSIEYVLYREIVEFHGEKWTEKYREVAGDGNTGIVVPEIGLGIYYDDYTRFADVVDGITKGTHWD